MTTGNPAIDQLIRDLQKIPTNINTQVDVKDILKKLDEELKKQNRRYNSYV